VVAVSAPANLKAGQAEYDCYLLGLQAAQNGDTTYEQRVRDKCGPDTSHKRDAWVSGAYDKTYYSTNANKWYSIASDPSTSSTGKYVADWFAWGHVGQTISGCPSDYPDLYRGMCYQECEDGFFGYHLNRGDVCVSCPSGGSTVNLEGDGQVYCYP
jgi:hypothetical protein